MKSVFSFPGLCIHSDFFWQGIYVGYRSYEIRQLAPLFPFGHGLSYTSFAYTDLSTTTILADGKFSVSFIITNKGLVSGREVAQVYIAAPQSSLPRPLKELKGFTKVYLGPGESKKVTVELERDALSYYDDRQMTWVVEKGIFEVLVAASANDVKLKGEVVVEKGFSWTGL